MIKINGKGEKSGDTEEAEPEAPDLQEKGENDESGNCLLYTSPSPRDRG